MNEHDIIDPGRSDDRSTAPSSNGATGNGPDTGSNGNGHDATAPDVADLVVADPSAGRPQHDELARFRWGFALSGGGSQGAYTAGVIEAFRRRGLFDRDDTVRLVHGVSTGSLIATLVALGEFDRLREIYTTVTTRQILAPNHHVLYRLAGRDIVPVLAACALLGPPNVFDTAPLRQIITGEMGEHDERFAELIAQRERVEIGYTSVDLQSGGIRCYTNQDDDITPQTLREALLASTNQPVLMDLVEVGPSRDKHCDGGVRQLMPFDRVTHSRFADELDVIVCVMLDPPHPKFDDSEYTTIADIMRRTIELLGFNVGENDVARGFLADALYRCRHTIITRLGPQAWEELESDLPPAVREMVDKLVPPMHRAYEFIRIQPTHLDFADVLKFDPAEMQRAWDQGLADTHAALEDWWRTRGQFLRPSGRDDRPWPHRDPDRMPESGSGDAHAARPSDDDTAARRAASRETRRLSGPPEGCRS